MVERLVTLLQTPSPTGDTGDALALVAGWLSEMGLTPVFTKKGALTVTLPGAERDAPRAVTGHVDTLGGIVTQIKPNGRLTFDRIGGYPYFAVNGEYCWVRTADGRLLHGDRVCWSSRPSTCTASRCATANGRSTRWRSGWMRRRRRPRKCAGWASRSAT